MIEGCYGELVQAASAHCNVRVFLNPGLETCLEHNRRRPWEPHKYASKEAQDAMLAWVAGPHERGDQWSYQAHRRIYDAFAGHKSEHLDDTGARGRWGFTGLPVGNRTCFPIPRSAP